jgi:hypothetical protein
MNIISPLLRALFSAGLGRLPQAYQWTASAMAWVFGRRMPQILWIGRRIPLSDAASITLEEARLCRSILADAAERLGPDKSPDAVLDYIATYIAKHSNIWGKRQPSTKIELIGPRQSKKGTLSDAGSTLSFHDPNHTVFTGLQIDRTDLQRVLRELREGLKTDTKTGADNE